MNLTIGIPIIDSVPGEAFYNHALLIAMIARTCKVCIPQCQNIKPHDRARAWIFDCALKSESDYLLFLDDDMIIPHTAFCDLLDQFVGKSPRPVAVSGHYYRRGYPYTSVWSKLIEGEWHNMDASSGVHDIDVSGLGCCLIDVNWVRDNLKPPYFTMGVDDVASTVTDDTSFFDKIRKAGGRVLGNANVRCGHLGARELIYDGSVEFLRQKTLTTQSILAGDTKNQSSAVE